MRLCFAEGCIDGRATLRQTADGDILVSSIINNTSQFGKYPKKMATSLMLDQLNEIFPNQIVIFGSDNAPFTELAFGEQASASLVGPEPFKSKGGKSIEREKFKRYLGIPAVKEGIE